MFERQKIIDFIEDKHLSDGGYFFAKVLPSGGVDTYYAVKSLRLLGAKPEAASIVSFWRENERSGNISDLTGLYLLTKTYQVLNIPLPKKKVYHDLLITELHSSRLFQWRKFLTIESGTIGLYEQSVNVNYTEILEGELRELAYLTELLLDYHIPFQKIKVVEFVLSLQNKDGGFGKMRDSQLATTYYSLYILSLLSSCTVAKTVLPYLEKNRIHVLYLEDLFWLEESLVLLHVPRVSFQYILDFCAECARADGGFSRSRFMGISTLEYTYYVVQLLVRLQTEHNFVWKDI